MLTNQELFHYTVTCTYQYREFFTAFPAIIGFHPSRLRSFRLDRKTEVTFPAQPSQQEFCEVIESRIESRWYADIHVYKHTCQFEQVIGTEVNCDEVYFPHPQQEKRWMSGKEIDWMLKEKAYQEATEQFRAMHTGIWISEREEVEICEECYRRYTPMRKLQEIYDPWYAPGCDYCDRQASYHIHRSEWVGPFSGMKEKD